MAASPSSPSRPPLPPPLSASPMVRSEPNPSAPTTRPYAPLFSLLSPLEEHSRRGHSHLDAGSTRVDARPASGSPAARVFDNEGSGHENEAASLLRDDAQPHTSLRDETLDSASATSLFTRCATFLRELRRDYETEMVPERVPQRFTPAQRQRMQRYESVDAYEPETTLFKDHLETRSHEPRWFIWCFVVFLGLAASAVAVLLVGVLHVLQRIRMEALALGLGGFRRPEGAPADYRGIFTGQSQPLEPADAHRSLAGGYASLMAFSLLCAAFASLVAAVVPESVGAGTPEVLAYFNGVSFSAVLSSTRALVAKVVIVALTSASSVCGGGHYGPLMLTGAMLGAQALQRRRWVRFPNVHLVECFRNPRDERIVIMIGAAAGLASVLSVSVGGLLVVMEMLTTVFPTHFALYVFVACLVSCLSVQAFFSYVSYFDLRDRDAVVAALAALEEDAGLANASDTLLAPHPLQLFSGMGIHFQTALAFGEQVKMNIFQFPPAVLLGLACGYLSAVYIRLYWVAVRLRRQLEVLCRSKRVVRFALPVVFTLLCVSLQFGLVVCVFGGGGRGHRGRRDGGGEKDEARRTLSDGCVRVPLSVNTTRSTNSIGFYGLSSLFCEDQPSFTGPQQRSPSAALSAESASPTAEQEDNAEAPRIHAYASLAFANADSVVQTLLTVRATDLLSAPVLSVFLVVYFLLSAIYSGVALSLDTILPPMVVGGCFGRLVGLGVARVANAAAKHAMAHASSLSSVSSSPSLLSAVWVWLGVRLHEAPGGVVWADPGVFALIGAGAFLSGTSGLTFSVAAILMETTCDFHHLLPLMVGISIARKTAELLTHDFHAVYLAMRCVPLLNYGKRVHKLAMFDAKDVMAPQPPAMRNSRTVDGHTEATDSAASASCCCLPAITTVRAVVAVMLTTTHNAFPVVSVHDASFKGLITRRQMELLLWFMSLARGASDARAGAAAAAAIATTPTYEVLCQRLPDYLFHTGLRRHSDAWRSLVPGTAGTSGRAASASHTAAKLSHVTLSQVLDLSPYFDASALTALTSTTLPRVYELFTTLGLRHVVVVDLQNRVRGMITRKELVADSIMRRVTSANAQREALVRQVRQQRRDEAGNILVSVSDGRDQREALLFAADPSTMNERVVVPLGAPAAAAAEEHESDDWPQASALAVMPLHPQSAQVAASLRYRRREDRAAAAAAVLTAERSAGTVGQRREREEGSGGGTHHP